MKTIRDIMLEIYIDLISEESMKQEFETKLDMLKNVDNRYEEDILFLKDIISKIEEGINDFSIKNGFSSEEIRNDFLLYNKTKHFENIIRKSICSYYKDISDDLIPSHVIKEEGDCDYTKIKSEIITKISRYNFDRFGYLKKEGINIIEENVENLNNDIYVELFKEILKNKEKNIILNIEEKNIEEENIFDLIMKIGFENFKDQQCFTLFLREKEFKKLKELKIEKYGESILEKEGFCDNSFYYAFKNYEDSNKCLSVFKRNNEYFNEESETFGVLICLNSIDRFCEKISFEDLESVNGDFIVKTTIEEEFILNNNILTFSHK